MKLALSATPLAFVLGGCGGVIASVVPGSECGSYEPQNLAFQAGCTRQLRREWTEDDVLQVSLIRTEFDDRGQPVLEELSRVGGSTTRTTTEYDAAGNVVRVERTTSDDPSYLGGAIYERDSRGLLLRVLDLGENVITEFDVSPEECTWSEERQFSGGELTEVTRTVWEDERPVLVIVDDLDDAESMVEYRYEYDELDRNVSEEVWVGSARSHRTESFYDSDGNLSFRQRTYAPDANGAPSSGNYEESWEYNRYGDPMLYQRSSQRFNSSYVAKWRGRFVNAVDSYEDGELIRQTKASWSCPTE